jgi:hypothetical protein
LRVTRAPEPQIPSPRSEWDFQRQSSGTDDGASRIDAAEQTGLLPRVPGFLPESIRVLFEQQLQRLPQQPTLRDVRLIGKQFQLLRRFVGNIEPELTARASASFRH